jgi:metallophosphoesterase superfamily enzyme
MQQSTRPETLDSDHSDDIAFGHEHPQMQIRRPRPVISREPRSFEQCGHCGEIR